jgi:hypothetical protein
MYELLSMYAGSCSIIDLKGKPITRYSVYRRGKSPDIQRLPHGLTYHEDCQSVAFQIQQYQTSSPCETKIIIFCPLRCSK